ncbi:MAG: glycosyltransferase family 4 protein [Acidimicrobiia bacterium]
MKVGLVCPYDLSLPGGVQNQVLALATRLNALGEETVVIGPGLPEGVAGLDLGATVSVPGNRSRAPISLDPRVRGLIREGAADCDVLHVHEPLMPTVSLASLRAGPPVVVTFHAAPGIVVRGLYRGLSHGVRLVLGPMVRRVTAVSSTAAAPLWAGMEVAIVANGVDVGAMLVPTERRSHRVAFLGRDEPRKGLDLLLEVWPRVLAAVPDAELVVMGADRGTPGVQWLGRVGDDVKAEMLSSSSVFVAPHTGGESFGITLVEAMAAGAAVVASNLGAFVDVAQNAARYFPVGDVSRLADALIELLDDREVREVLASRGEVRAANFDWSHVLKAYRAEYRAAFT